MHFDPDSVTRLLEETAAEEILPRFRTLKPHEVSQKDSGEVVTVADVAAERRIHRQLCDLYPGSRVVGEEATAEDPRLLDLLSGAEPVWLVDPVDGTANFAAGRPVFAVMVALLRGGRILAAWIHDPIAGRTAVAEAGAGAWMAGERLTTASGVALGDMRGTLYADRFATPEMAAQVKSRRDRLHTIKSLRCAGVEYLRMASGETHFSLYTKLMPWDHAPGVLIHGEAGGTARTLDGMPYDPARRDATALLVAPDTHSWHALHETLFENGS